MARKGSKIIKKVMIWLNDFDELGDERPVIRDWVKRLTRWVIDISVGGFLWNLSIWGIFGVVFTWYSWFLWGVFIWAMFTFIEAYFKLRHKWK